MSSFVGCDQKGSESTNEPPSPPDYICYDRWPGPAITVTIINGWIPQANEGDTYYYTDVHDRFRYGMAYMGSAGWVMLEGQAWNDWIMDNRLVATRPVRLAGTP